MALSRDAIYTGAVDEVLAAMRHGMAYVGTALTFEFTMATVIIGLLALVAKETGDPASALQELPGEYRFIGVLLILSTIVVPVCAQFLICRAARRHDIARRIQRELFKTSSASRLQRMPVDRLDLTKWGYESWRPAQWLLASCTALGMVGLALWVQCVWVGRPGNVWVLRLSYFLLLVLAGCAVSVQIMAFERSVTRHRIDDLGDKVRGPRWLGSRNLGSDCWFLILKAFNPLRPALRWILSCRPLAWFHVSWGGVRWDGTDWDNHGFLSEYNDASQIRHDVAGSCLCMAVALGVWILLASVLVRWYPSPPQRSGDVSGSGLTCHLETSHSPLLILQVPAGLGPVEMYVKEVGNARFEPVRLDNVYCALLPSDVSGAFAVRVRYGTKTYCWTRELPRPAGSSFFLYLEEAAGEKGCPASSPKWPTVRAARVKHVARR